MKKIYILCPYSVTGGPQTLHQFVDKVNNLKLADAYIVYTNKKNKVISSYEHYNIKVSTKIEDNDDNILIVPEVLTNYLKKYNKIKKVIWWLSLDFFEKANIDSSFDKFIKKRKYLKIFKPIIKVLFKMFSKSARAYKFDDNNQYFHLYNCEYIKQYLIKNGIKKKNMLYLCGPINDEYFFPENIKRKNIVVYNPKKGIEYTQQIINYFKDKNSDIEFKKIENMNSIEIKKLLNESKVYIDFGYFPGPERIPREAVSMNCCIVTGLAGSSINNIDVPIPKKYKFNREKLDLELIYTSINELIYNYDKYVKEFDIYRKKVKEQVNLFDKNIKHFI